MKKLRETFEVFKDILSVIGSKRGLPYPAEPENQTDPMNQLRHNASATLDEMSNIIATLPPEDKEQNKDFIDFINEIKAGVEHSIMKDGLKVSSIEASITEYETREKEQQPKLEQDLKERFEQFKAQLSTIGGDTLKPKGEKEVAFIDEVRKGALNNLGKMHKTISGWPTKAREDNKEFVNLIEGIYSDVRLGDYKISDIEKNIKSYEDTGKAPLSLKDVAAPTEDIGSPSPQDVPPMAPHLKDKHIDVTTPIGLGVGAGGVMLGSVSVLALVELEAAAITATATVLAFSMAAPIVLIATGLTVAIAGMAMEAGREGGMGRG